MKRLLSVLLCSILLLSCFTPNDSTIALNDINTISRACYESTSLAIAEIVIDSINENNDDSYGGVFIDSSGKLNICITEDFFNSNKVNFQNMIDNTFTPQSVMFTDPENVVLYRKVKYSEQYLSCLQSSLRGHMEEFGIKGMGVSQKDNKLLIEVSNLSYRSNIETFLYENIVDFCPDSIEVTLSESELEESVAVSDNELTNYPIIPTSTYDIYAGETILFKGGIGTVGFIAKKINSNQYGIVTAAHVVKIPYGSSVNPYPDLSVFENTTHAIIGKVSSFAYNTQLDAAFIPFESQSSWNKSCQARRAAGTSGTPVSTNIYDDLVSSSIVQGMTVKKYGATTGVVHGTVELASYDASNYAVSNPIVLNDTIKLDLVADDGDSGGPILAVYGANPSNLIGITSQKMNDGAKTVAIKSVKITTQFGLVPVTTSNNNCDCH